MFSDVFDGRQPELLLEYLEAGGLLFWVMKDFGWVLCMPFIGWPAACMALGLESSALFMQINKEPLFLWGHRVVILMWLTGNLTWMTFEFIWGDDTQPGLRWPWFQRPLANDGLAGNDQLYNAGQMVARCTFGAALCWIAFLDIKTFGERLLRPQQTEESQAMEDGSQAKPEPLVFGFITKDEHELMFIGPWLVKDFFWTWPIFVPSIIGAFLALAIMLDNYRRFRDGGMFVEILWVCGNAVWIYDESIVNDPDHTLRIISGSILGVGMLLALNRFLTRGKAHAGKASEASPLLTPRQAVQ